MFGDRDPNTITRREVRAVLTPIEERKPPEARKALGALGQLFRWLLKERQEYLGVTNNPTAGMDKPGKVVERTRVFADDEIRAILRTAILRTASRRRGAHATMLADFVEFLFCTGTRDDETRGMRWAEVDLTRAVWTIPAERSKNRKPHAVALSPRALAVLRRRPRFGEFVFANPETRRPYPRNTPERRDVAIGAGLLTYTGTKDKEAWDGECLHRHDIRRTVGDRIKAEFGEAVMHNVLGHTDEKLTRNYGPTPRLRGIAEATEWWATERGRILGEKPAQEQQA